MFSHLFSAAYKFTSGPFIHVCVSGNTGQEQSNAQHGKPITHNSLLASKIRDRRVMHSGIKKVLSCFLNSPVSRVDLMSTGSFFHAFGAAISKALSEETSFVLGKSSSCLTTERSEAWPVWQSPRTLGRAYSRVHHD